MEEKTIIEVNGIKLEIDLRSAKKIENYKVGDNVKVLVDEGYSDSKDYRVYPGVIIGFEQFEKLPTIIVAYINTRYSDMDLKFLYFNKQNKKYEITHAEPDELIFEKSHAVGLLDKDIEKKEIELAEAKSKKEYFIKHFNQYFKR